MAAADGHRERRGNVPAIVELYKDTELLTDTRTHSPHRCLLHLGAEKQVGEEEDVPELPGALRHFHQKAILHKLTGLESNQRENPAEPTSRELVQNIRRKLQLQLNDKVIFLFYSSILTRRLDTITITLILLSSKRK